MTGGRPVAVVTGASRGLGAAISVELARKGFDVFLTADGTADELRTVAAACGRVGPGSMATAVFDLAEPDGAERMAASALVRFGRVDVLVNNAGVRRAAPFGTFTRADFKLLLDVNLAAAFFASQAVLPAMRAQGGGRIIHIASQMGTVAAWSNALYGLSKAALIHLTRSMALELSADNILVNSVSPGPIETEFITHRYAANPAERAAMEGRVPLGRFGQPDEVAEVVAFLATTKGRYIQGHDLVVDGGYVVH